MNIEDLNFLSEILNKSRWLLYGDLDQHLTSMLKTVFSHDFKDFGFNNIKIGPYFELAYWLLISELTALNLFEYGTSPRSGWLTKEGERFKQLVMMHDDAIGEANDYLYKN